jgi:hypothetical protein
MIHACIIICWATAVGWSWDSALEIQQEPGTPMVNDVNVDSSSSLSPAKE